MKETTTAVGDEVVLKTSDVEQLRASLTGPLILRSDSSYAKIRSVWNGMVDRCPLLIARCHSLGDVQNCLHFVRNQGLRVSVRGGGHNVAGHAVCEGGLVVDLSDMRAVEVGQDKSTVVIQGGATLGDVDMRTHPYGLATPMGVVTATGYAGLTLHGGMGWMLRKYGLATDNVVELEVVTADERVLRVNAQEHPDLFWALRGGGGSFGVVTTFRSKLYAVPPAVLMPVFIYPLDQSGRVLGFLREFMPQAPEELMVLGAFWTVPDKPEIPAAHHGQHAFFVIAGWLGNPDEGEKAVAPLKQCAPRLADLSYRSTWMGIQQFFDEDYPDGRRYYWKSKFATELSDSVIDLMQEHAVSRPSLLTSIDVWFMGGAYARVPAEATAFGDRSAPYLINYEANWDDPGQDQANVQWARESLAKVQALTQTRTYLNFPGQGEEGEALLQAAYGRNYARLQNVKRAYDPQNVFRSHLSIVPG